jgi:acyl-CoA synthetase (AMP-forming)/AMP-acid ligase II
MTSPHGVEEDKGRYFSALLEHAAGEPGRPCLELYSAGRTISFGEMERGIARTARYFHSHGVKEGDIVLIFAHHDAGTLWSFFAAQALGAIPSFMPPPTGRQPLELWLKDHAAVVERIAPALLVCESGLLGHVSQLGGHRIVTTSEAEEGDGTDGPLRPKPERPDQIAFLQHSSGTTGLKKGVTVTYGQLQAQISTYASVLGIRKSDCVVSWLPIYHDMGLVAATLMPFVLGMPISLIDSLHWLEEPSTYLELLTSRPNSFSWLPNFAFPFLAQRGSLADASDLRGVRAIINCSEPCKAGAMDRFRTRFRAHGLPETAVQVCYAMAEYVFAVTQTDMSGLPNVLSVDAETFDTQHRAVSAADWSRRFVSVGKPIPNTEIRIADGASEGTVGDIFVRGSSLCSGYFRNLEATQKKFVDGWYRTGDVGFIRDGELYITGREDDIIIVRGKNIYAHDVEMLATDTGLVRPGRVVAVGVEDAESGTQNLVVIAELSSAAGKQASRAIRLAIRETYGLSPADVVLVEPDTLIKTTSGKISRSENRLRYLRGQLTSWTAGKDATHAG